MICLLILEMGRGQESRHWAVSRTGREEGMYSPLKTSVEISPIDTFTSDLFLTSNLENCKMMHTFVLF